MPPTIIFTVGRGPALVFVEVELGLPVLQAARVSASAPAATTATMLCFLMVVLFSFRESRDPGRLWGGGNGGIWSDDSDRLSLGAVGGTPAQKRALQQGDQELRRERDNGRDDHAGKYGVRVKGALSR